MLMAMKSRIFAISAGFSDRSEWLTDSLMVSHRWSVISGNILHQIDHQSDDASRMRSRSRGEGSRSFKAATRLLDLLYRDRDISTGPSFRLRTALSNKVSAGAPSRSPPGSGIASSTSGGTAVVRRLFKTSAAV